MRNNHFSGEIFAIYFSFKGCSFCKNYNLVKVSQKILRGLN